MTSPSTERPAQPDCGDEGEQCRRLTWPVSSARARVPLGRDDDIVHLALERIGDFPHESESGVCYLVAFVVENLMSSGNGHPFYFLLDSSSTERLAGYYLVSNPVELTALSNVVRSVRSCQDGSHQAMAPDVWDCGNRIHFGVMSTSRPFRRSEATYWREKGLMVAQPLYRRRIGGQSSYVNTQAAPFIASNRSARAA